jgi:hypothetical protein
MHPRRHRCLPFPLSTFAPFSTDHAKTARQWRLKSTLLSRHSDSCTSPTTVSLRRKLTSALNGCVPVTWPSPIVSDESTPPPPSPLVSPLLCCIVCSPALLHPFADECFDLIKLVRHTRCRVPAFSVCPPPQSSLPRTHPAVLTTGATLDWARKKYLNTCFRQKKSPVCAGHQTSRRALKAETRTTQNSPTYGYRTSCYRGSGMHKETSST